jgi:hypothetical protein
MGPRWLQTPRRPASGKQRAPEPQARALLSRSAVRLEGLGKPHPDGPPRPPRHAGPDAAVGPGDTSGADAAARSVTRPRSPPVPEHQVEHKSDGMTGRARSVQPNRDGLQEDDRQPTSGHLFAPGRGSSPPNAAPGTRTPGLPKPCGPRWWTRHAFTAQRDGCARTLTSRLQRAARVPPSPHPRVAQSARPSCRPKTSRSSRWRPHVSDDTRAPGLWQRGCVGRRRLLACCRPDGCGGADPERAALHDPTSPGTGCVAARGTSPRPDQRAVRVPQPSGPRVTQHGLASVSSADSGRPLPRRPTSPRQPGRPLADHRSGRPQPLWRSRPSQ